jgi:hypothetical protein
MLRAFAETPARGVCGDLWGAGVAARAARLLARSTSVCLLRPLILELVARLHRWRLYLRANPRGWRRDRLFSGLTLQHFLRISTRLNERRSKGGKRTITTLAHATPNDPPTGRGKCFAFPENRLEPVYVRLVCSLIVNVRWDEWSGCTICAPPSARKRL